MEYSGGSEAFSGSVNGCAPNYAETFSEDGCLLCVSDIKHMFIDINNWLYSSRSTQCCVPML